MANSARKCLLAFTGALFLLTACQTEEITPTPTFSYISTDLGLRTILPRNAGVVGGFIKLTNTSTEAISYRWDLGDGNSSTEKEPTIAYSKSGTYTIALATTSSTGRQRVATQSIKILDCVLKTITISGFKWNYIGEVPSWDDSKKADLSLEFGQHVTNDPPLIIGVKLYRSDPVKNVTNTAGSFNIPVSQKVLLNPVDRSNFVVDLYGNDRNGDRVVYSSNASVVGYMMNLSNTGLYTITSGPAKLECTYE